MSKIRVSRGRKLLPKFEGSDIYERLFKAWPRAVRREDRLEILWGGRGESGSGKRPQWWSPRILGMFVAPEELWSILL